jgi:anti-anti-sigma regulatory factor
VIFSLFGKRKEGREARGKVRAPREGEPTTTQSTTAATTTISQREIARRTAQKIDEIESQMNLSIPAKVVKGPAGPGPAPQDTTVGVHPEPTAVLEDNLVATKPASPLPQGGPVNRAPGAVAESTTSVMLGDTRSANAMEVLTSGMLPVFEEASVLYANKQSTAAAMILWQAIKENRLGPQTEQAWKMLFELYQAAGRQPEFESLAIDYASRFESSPPAWHEELAPVAEPRAAPTARGSAIVFPEMLDVHALKQIEALQRAVQRGRLAEVDFSMVRRADEIGAETLLRALVDIRKAAAKVALSGVDELRIALTKSVETGRRDASDACWLLILETLRLLNQQQAFEDVAIDYCVTYEVSPPSWEPMPGSIRLVNGIGGSAATTLQAAAEPEGDPDVFALTGEIDGRPADLFKSLKGFARNHQEIVIDCRRLRRLDFVCAGEMLNEVAGLRAAGKFIVFRDLSHLVACLMMVMGIHDLAELNLRTA